MLFKFYIRLKLMHFLWEIAFQNVLRKYRFCWYSSLNLFIHKCCQSTILLQQSKALHNFPHFNMALKWSLFSILHPTLRQCFLLSAVTVTYSEMFLIFHIRILLFRKFAHHLVSNAKTYPIGATIKLIFYKGNHETLITITTLL